jgi:hypothetical protein
MYHFPKELYPKKIILGKLGLLRPFPMGGFLPFKHWYLLGTNSTTNTFSLLLILIKIYLCETHFKLFRVIDEM